MVDLNLSAEQIRLDEIYAEMQSHPRCCDCGTEIGEYERWCSIACCDEVYDDE